VEAGVEGGEILVNVETPGLVMEGFMPGEEVIFAVLAGEGERIFHPPLARLPVGDKQGKHPVPHRQVPPQRREGNRAFERGFSAREGAELGNVLDLDGYIEG
jgi:hypothetical protein